MLITNNDILSATAPLQVCAGLLGGAEAAIHAIRSMYEDDKTEVILLVDADNAFNRLNRQTALHNIQYICPDIAHYIVNTYRTPSKLFISNTDEAILSQVGVTQGDNSAMAKKKNKKMLVWSGTHAHLGLNMPLESYSTN